MLQYSGKCQDCIKRLRLCDLSHASSRAHQIGGSALAEVMSSYAFNINSADGTKLRLFFACLTRNCLLPVAIIKRRIGQRPKQRANQLRIVRVCSPQNVERGEPIAMRNDGLR